MRKELQGKSELWRNTREEAELLRLLAATDASDFQTRTQTGFEPQLLILSRLHSAFSIAYVSLDSLKQVRSSASLSTILSFKDRIFYLVFFPRFITLWQLSSQVRYCTISPEGIVQFLLCNKAVVNVFPQKAEPSYATRTGQYLLDWWYHVSLFR